MYIKKIEVQVIEFPYQRKSDWRRDLSLKVKRLEPGLATINSKDWLLGCRDLRGLKFSLEQTGLEIESIQSYIPETIVSATAMGFNAKLLTYEKVNTTSDNSSFPIENDQIDKSTTELIFHKGTLRSGENLETEGDLLLLGNVNPGAQVSAGGDVLVWGKLRGVAHAGKDGNSKAKIVALQLRPLQLRIASEVARGPADNAEPGLAEQARLVNNSIVIEPAVPKF